MNKRYSIQVFEHKRLRVGEVYINNADVERNEIKFKQKHFEALAKLNELHGNKYFTVQHKSILFSQYVGIVQIDGLTIEILPKIDNTDEDTELWRDALIEMLKQTKKIKVNNIGNANVKKQNIHLLDIYFEWFLEEVQNLIRKGLIKKYDTQSKNVKALKGKLEFANHIRNNIVHKERFFTSHQVYHKDHTLHQILQQATQIVEGLSKGTYLYSKCKIVQLDFPEVSKIQCTEAIFSKIKYNRKTAPYKTAIEIARLIILNYAPNISRGSEKMLALLFDMNMLWEEFVLINLKREAQKSEIEIYGQQSKTFWNTTRIRPDIVIKRNNEKSETNGNEVFVIDTKWKDYNKNKVTTQDLRQMYVYSDYWKASKTLLLSPNNETNTPVFSNYKDRPFNTAIAKINILKDQKLRSDLGETILKWFI